jgi:hypothetical protein
MDLRIYAKGTSFPDDGVYDLRHLESIISSQRKILDKLTFISLGISESNKKFKEELDYRIKVNPGSIELLIDFALNHKELFATLSIDGGQSLAKIVVDLWRDAVSLREKAAQALEKGLKINIAINANIGSGTQIISASNVVADEHTGNIQISSPKIYMAALATRPAVNQTIKMIDGKAVEFMEIQSLNSELKLTPEHRAILGRHREELLVSMELIGRLDMVAFSSHKGVIISSGQRYQLSWDEEQRPKMQRYVDTEGVIFKVRPIIDHARLTQDAIAFRLVDCYEPQHKLL